MRFCLYTNNTQTKLFNYVYKNDPKKTTNCEIRDYFYMLFRISNNRTVVLRTYLFDYTYTDYKISGYV